MIKISITILMLLSVSLSFVIKDGASFIIKGGRFTIASGESIVVPDIIIPPSGRFLQIYPITNQWVAVVADDNDWIMNKAISENITTLNTWDKFGLGLGNDDYEGDRAYRGIFNNYFIQWRPYFSKKYQDKNNFTILVNNTPKTIIELDYWQGAGEEINITGTVRGGLCIDPEAMLKTFDYMFIRLDSAIPNGATINVSISSEISASCDSDALFGVTSNAIRVNDIGYIANQGDKFGYFGYSCLRPGVVTASWAPIDVTPSHWSLINADTQASVGYGVLTNRVADSIKSGYKMNYGDKVYEFNFGAVSTSGNYFIYIPEVGHSRTFRITNEAYDDTFDWVLKAMYNQRCHSNSGEIPACYPVTVDLHQVVYQGLYDPIQGQSYAHSFVDSKNVDRTSSFEGDDLSDAIKELKTQNPTNNVITDSVGYHDAADKDRRNQHCVIVPYLSVLSIALSTNFYDGQFSQLPKNGIPDIVDELIYSCQGIRNIQKATATTFNGAVCSTIQSWGHIDAPFYLAFPNRLTTAEWGVNFSLCALAIKQSSPNSFEYTDMLAGAVAAYDFIISNVTRSYTVSTNSWGILTYRDKSALTDTDGYMTMLAANLWILTNDPKYLQKWNSLSSTYTTNCGLIYTTAPYGAFYSFPILIYPGFTTTKNALSTAINSQANSDISDQLSSAYRQLGGVGWGTQYSRMNFMIMATVISADISKRNRISNHMNNFFAGGCYPQGALTGIGQAGEYTFLGDDRINPDVQKGIPVYQLGSETIYAFFESGGLPYPNLLTYAQHGDDWFNPFSKDGKTGDVIPTASCVPSYWGVSSKDVTGELEPFFKGTIPYYRYYVRGGGANVPQSEFTVWETIVPMLLNLGMFLTPTYKTPSSIINYAPDVDRHSGNLKRRYYLLP